MEGNLPWPMIIVGVVMALFLYLVDLPIMTVAIGFYLPISTTSIILVGALIRVFIITPGTPTGFVASNGMAIIVLILLVLATTLPIMKSKVKH